MTAPTGIEFVGNGISRAVADGRYIRRFVVIGGVATLAGDTRSQVNGGGVTEPVLESPDGVLQSRIPANALINGQWEDGDGARIGGRIKVMRAGDYPIIRFVRMNGTFAAPTAVLLNENIGAVDFTPWTGAVVGSTAGIRVFATENQSATNRGCAVEVRFTPTTGAGAVGGFTLDGTSGVTRWRSTGQATLRVVPLTTGELRNPSDSATLLGWNATGLGMFGVAPVARSAAIPNAAGGAVIDVEARAALNALLTYLRLLGPITP